MSLFFISSTKKSTKILIILLKSEKHQCVKKSISREILDLKLKISFDFLE